VALFAGICEEEFTIRITDIATGFPDCYARDAAGREIGIEFEYESSRFNHPSLAAARPGRSGHGHCDWVVCWIDNAKRGERWRKKLKVVELSSLKRFAELGAAVWIQPYGPDSVERLIGRKLHNGWTVPSQARKGDLLLVYRSGPRAAITHIMALRSTAEFSKRHPWGRGFQANLRTVIELPNPVRRTALLSIPELAGVSFFKRPTPLGQNVLSHWREIERCLLDHNPRVGLVKAVEPFKPKPHQAAMGD
jgi:hypothetical protein